MASLAAKLSFILAERDTPWIGRETGIPTASIEAFVSGARTPTDRQARLIRNTYQREGYGRLREQGFSASEARRFSWYSSTAVVTRGEQVTQVIKIMAEGLTAKTVKDMEDKGLYADAEEIYAKSYKSVLEGMRKSTKTFEEWEKYPGRISEED